MNKLDPSLTTSHPIDPPQNSIDNEYHSTHPSCLNDNTNSSSASKQEALLDNQSPIATLDHNVSIGNIVEKDIEGIGLNKNGSTLENKGEVAKEEDGSHSDSSDSSDDDSSSSSSDFMEELRKSSSRGGVFRGDTHDDDEEDSIDGGKSFQIPRTLNELDYFQQDDTLPIENPLSSPSNIAFLGKISSIVGNAMVIKSELQNQTLQLGTLLFLMANGKPIGRIIDTFGPVVSPFHVVLIPPKKFNSSHHGSNQNAQELNSHKEQHFEQPLKPLSDDISIDSEKRSVEQQNIAFSQQASNDDSKKSEEIADPHRQSPDASSTSGNDTTHPIEKHNSNLNPSILVNVEDISIGDEIGFDSSSCKFVEASQIYSKGYDASDANDEELPPELQEFSDDEEEQKAKMKKKRLRQQSISNSRNAHAANQEKNHYLHKFKFNGSNENDIEDQDSVEEHEETEPVMKRQKRTDSHDSQVFHQYPQHLQHSTMQSGISPSQPIPFGAPMNAPAWFPPAQYPFPPTGLHHDQQFMNPLNNPMYYYSLMNPAAMMMMMGMRPPAVPGNSAAPGTLPLPQFPTTTSQNINSNNHLETQVHEFYKRNGTSQGMRIKKQPNS